MFFKLVLVMLVLIASCSAADTWSISFELEGSGCLHDNSFTLGNVICASSYMTVWIDNVKGSFRSFYFTNPLFDRPSLNFFTDTSCSQGKQYFHVDPDTCFALLGNNTGCTPYTCAPTCEIDLFGTYYQLTGFNYTFV